MRVGGWNPWRALRAREDVRLRYKQHHPSMGLGSVEIRNGVPTVFLNPDLSRVEANSTLAHEMIHLERGVPPVDCPPLLREKDEAATRRVTAERLVPPGALVAFVNARAEIGAVTASDVADEFEVTLDVAMEAMRRVA